jgi:hypothetical protein
MKYFPPLFSNGFAFHGMHKIRGGNRTQTIHLKKEKGALHVTAAHLINLSGNLP